MLRFPVRAAVLAGLVALWAAPLQPWSGTAAAHADSAASIASVSPTYASPMLTTSMRLTITTAQPIDTPSVRLVAPAGSGQPDLVGEDTTVDNTGTVITTDVQPGAAQGGIGAAPGDYTLDVCDDPQCATPLETGSFRFVAPPPAVYDLSLAAVRPGTSVPFAMSGDFFTAGSQVSFSGPAGDLAFSGTIQPPVGPAVPASSSSGPCRLPVRCRALRRRRDRRLGSLGDLARCSRRSPPEAPTPPATVVTPSVVPPDGNAAPISENSSLVISGSTVQPSAEVSAPSVIESQPDGVATSHPVPTTAMTRRSMSTCGPGPVRGI